MLERVTRYSSETPCPVGHVGDRYVKTGRCVQCAAVGRKKYRAENPDLVRSKRREKDKENRSQINERARQWRASNAPKVAAALRRWNHKNKTRQREYQRGRKDERNASNRRRKRERRQNDPLFALQQAARVMVGSAFRRRGYKKGSSTAAIIGCSWPELKRHIELQFLAGMTWANRGVAWHIDHIQALAEAATADDIAALCHFTNLRPLWALENQQKAAKRLNLI